jgi:hypothetical protein
MKKIILSALAIATLQLVRAQQNQAPVQPVQQNQAPTPEQMATRQSTHLQKVLGLSEDQKQKVYQAALTRSTAIQQLRGKDGGNRRELHADAKPVKQQFVSDVNATLTPEQQQKWEQYRLQQKQKQEQRRQQLRTSNTGTPPANNATTTPTKLEPSDDGLNDK